MKADSKALPNRIWWYLPAGSVKMTMDYTLPLHFHVPPKHQQCEKVERERQSKHGDRHQVQSTRVVHDGVVSVHAGRAAGTAAANVAVDERLAPVTVPARAAH